MSPSIAAHASSPNGAARERPRIRLVEVAKDHCVEIVLSETTLQRAGGGIATMPLGVATVRGKAVPVAIHSLTD